MARISRSRGRLAPPSLQQGPERRHEPTGNAPVRLPPLLPVGSLEVVQVLQMRALYKLEQAQTLGCLGRGTHQMCAGPDPMFNIARRSALRR